MTRWPTGLLLGVAITGPPTAEVRFVVGGHIREVWRLGPDGWATLVERCFAEYANTTAT